jgi:hypothetical protein
VTEVKTVAVIGAGIMGRGIAHAAAVGGYRTILEDLLPNALRKAETEIRANLDKAVELGKVSAGAADSAFARLEYAVDGGEWRELPSAEALRDLSSPYPQAPSTRSVARQRFSLRIRLPKHYQIRECHLSCEKCVACTSSTPSTK